MSDISLESNSDFYSPPEEKILLEDVEKKVKRDKEEEEEEEEFKEKGSQNSDGSLFELLDIKNNDENQSDLKKAERKIDTEDEIEEDWDEEIWEEVNNAEVSSEIRPKEIIISLPIKRDYDGEVKKRISLNVEQRRKLKAVHLAYLITFISVGLKLNHLQYDLELLSILLSILPQPILPYLDGTIKGREREALDWCYDWWMMHYEVKKCYGCYLCHQDESRDPPDLKQSLLEAVVGCTGCEALRNLALLLMFRSVGFLTRINIEILAPISYAPFASQEEKTRYYFKKVKLIPNRLSTLFGEVLLKDKKIWLTIIPEKGLVDEFFLLTNPGELKISSFYRLNQKVRAYQLNYIFGFSDQVIDITQKYVPNFVDYHKKLRKRFLYDKSWDGNPLKRILNMLISSYNQEDWEYQNKINEQFLKLHSKLPTQLKQFKGHPLFVLERFIKKDQQLRKGSKPIGYFKGEKIYPKESLQLLKTKRKWWQDEGRIILEQYIKDDETYLYPEDQTDIYLPSLIGTQPLNILANDYGSCDVFLPTMLPSDTIHVDLPYAELEAKQLGLEYLKALIGFKFNTAKGSMEPKYQGIVIKNMDYERLKTACKERLAKAKIQKSKERFKLAVKRWRKLINFLRLGKRLDEEYN